MEEKQALRGRARFLVGGNHQVECLQAQIRDGGIEDLMQYIGWVKDEDTGTLLPPMRLFRAAHLPRGHADDHPRVAEFRQTGHHHPGGKYPGSDRPTAAMATCFSPATWNISKIIFTSLKIAANTTNCARML